MPTLMLSEEATVRSRVMYLGAAREAVIVLMIPVSKISRTGNEPVVEAPCCRPWPQTAKAT